MLACRRYDAKADLWSVGAILWEMLAGSPPYGGSNHVALLRSIEAAPPKLPPALAAELSPRCVALLTALLTRDPVARISFPEFFTHPFLAQPASSADNMPTPQPGCVALPCAGLHRGADCGAASLQGVFAAARRAAARAKPGGRAAAVRARRGQRQRRRRAGCR